MRLGLHHDLVLVVYHRNAVVSLDHPVRGRQFRTLRVGDVALALLARGADVLAGRLQEVLDLANLGIVGRQLLGFLHAHRSRLLLLVALAVTLHDGARCLLHLGQLLAQLLMRAAPLLGGVRGEFAPVDGEVLLADQLELLAVQQHRAKQLDDLLLQLGHEPGDGREMRLRVG